MRMDLIGMNESVALEILCRFGLCPLQRDFLQCKVSKESMHENCITKEWILFWVL